LLTDIIPSSPAYLVTRC